MARTRLVQIVASGVGLAGLILGGCSTTRTRERPALYATIADPLTAEQIVMVEENCGPFGMPEKDWNFGRTDYVCREEYVLEHNASDRIPLWVAEHITANEWEGETRRPDASYWEDDPQLRAIDAPRAMVTDYKGSGYDRGHMAPNGDYGTFDARRATFYLSNAVPQNGSQNQGIWNQLEQKTRDLVEARGEAYVITGGMFYEAEDDPETGSSGDGVIEYFVIGANEVAVPTHTYKLIMAPESPGSQTWEAYAFVISNSAKSSPYVWANYSKSVDWVERRTGFDFFPAMTGPQAEQIESSVLAPPF